MLAPGLGKCHTKVNKGKICLINGGWLIIRKSGIAKDRGRFGAIARYRCAVG